MTTASRPTIPAERYRDRIAAARDLAAEAGLAAILVGTGADMAYLAGYPASSLERLTMLVIPAVGDWALVAPRLEATPAHACPAAAGGFLPVVAWDEGSDAHAVVAGMVRVHKRHRFLARRKSAQLTYKIGSADAHFFL